MKTTSRDLNRGPSILTFTGKYLYFCDPRPDDIDIIDIAVALSREGRFAGHCISYYSVAQHCVIVSEGIEQELRNSDSPNLNNVLIAKASLLGLLHDASEAYMKDIPSPLKDLLPDYRKMEASLSEVIYDKFGLTYLLKDPMWMEHVRVFDKRAFATELNSLVKYGRGKDTGYSPLPIDIVPVSPDTACVRFLARFHELARIIIDASS